MSDKSLGEKDMSSKKLQDLFDQDIDESEAKQLGVSPSKARMLRQLTKGVVHGRSKSQLSMFIEKPHAELSNNHDNDDFEDVEEGALTHMGSVSRNLVDHHHQTQQGFNLDTPNKQSVLVKRVLGDGRIVSGIENYVRSKSDLLDDDQGTLGSNGFHTIARDSHVVNFATADGSDSRLHSTMYVTGKSQKFALKKNTQQSGNSPRANKKTTMVINLGERTLTNFNKKPEKDVDMVVGVTDIVTGASKVLHPSNKNFNPKIRPKHSHVVTDRLSQNSS